MILPTFIMNDILMDIEFLSYLRIPPGKMDWHA